MRSLQGADRDQRIDLTNPAGPPGSGAGPGPDRPDGDTTPDAAVTQGNYRLTLTVLSGYQPFASRPWMASCTTGFIVAGSTIPIATV